jgi:hypothetical protein
MLLTSQLSDLIQRNPCCEANSSSACQEIPRILWNQKVRDRFHNSPTRFPTPSQMNSVYAFSSYSFKIFDIILSSTPRSSKPSISFRIPHL